MKKLTVMALIACMAFSAVACGSSTTETTMICLRSGGDDGSSGRRGKRRRGQEDAEASDTAASSDKTWVIAMDTVFRPFEFTDENGDFVGIDVDILNAVRCRSGI